MKIKSKNGKIKHFNMNVKIIARVENITVGILAHVFVRSDQCDGIISVIDITFKKKTKTIATNVSKNSGDKK